MDTVWCVHVMHACIPGKAILLFAGMQAICFIFKAFKLQICWLQTSWPSKPSSTIGRTLEKKRPPLHHHAHHRHHHHQQHHEHYWQHLSGRNEHQQTNPKMQTFDPPIRKALQRWAGEQDGTVMSDYPSTNGNIWKQHETTPNLRVLPRKRILREGIHWKLCLPISFHLSIWGWSTRMVRVQSMAAPPIQDTMSKFWKYLTAAECHIWQPWIPQFQAPLTEFQNQSMRRQAGISMFHTLRFLFAMLSGSSLCSQLR